MTQITVEADPAYIDSRASAVVQAALASQKNVTLNQVAAPSSGGSAVNTGIAGVLTGPYVYRITFVTAEGETDLSPISTIATASASKIELSQIPTGPTGVIARKLYRAPVVAGAVVRYLATLNDNTTTVYLDNTPDVSVTQLPLNLNTTGGVVFNGNDAVVVADTAVTILGYNSGLTNATDQNTFIGAEVATSQTTGYWNTGIGHSAIKKVTQGYENTAVGTQALREVTTGFYNTAVGVAAGRDCTTGQQNVFVGIFSGVKANASNCVLIGTSTGQELTAPVGTVGVGHQAGTFIADGVTPQTLNEYGVYLGYLTKASANNTLNEVVIGPRATGSGNHSITLGANTNELVRLYGKIVSTTIASGGFNDFLDLVPDGTTAARGSKQRIIFRGQPTNQNGLFFTAAIYAGFDSSGYGSERFTIQSAVGGSLVDTLSLKAAKVGIKENNPDYELDVNGTFGFTPGSSVTPVDNGDVVFELTNNTTLTIKAKGSDGTVRSATVTLA